MLRRTKHGDKLVRAAPGRWCGRTEAAFFAALGRSGCVRTAAKAAGISTTALYERRANYPEFAERWAEVAARAAEELPGLLRAASIASLDPDVEGTDLPKVNVDQAIRISKMHGAREGRSGGGRGIRPRIATNPEVREALAKRLDAYRARVLAQPLAEGWTRTKAGRPIPPGWAYAGPSPEGEHGPA